MWEDLLCLSGFLQNFTQGLNWWKNYQKLSITTIKVSTLKFSFNFQSQDENEELLHNVKEILKGNNGR